MNLPAGTRCFFPDFHLMPARRCQPRHFRARQARAQYQDALLHGCRREWSINEFGGFQFRAQHGVHHTGDIAFQSQALKADIAGNAAANGDLALTKRLARPMRISRQRAAQ